MAARPVDAAHGKLPSDQAWDRALEPRAIADVPPEVRGEFLQRQLDASLELEAALDRVRADTREPSDVGVVLDDELEARMTEQRRAARSRTRYLRAQLAAHERTSPASPVR